MKRFMLVAALFFLGSATASAEYILIKINMNELNFFSKNFGAPGQPGGGFGGGGQPPPGPGPGGPGAQAPPPGGAGFGGGIGGAMQPPGGGPPQQPPDDPNARWVYSFIEIKGKPSSAGFPAFGAAGPVGWIYQIEHKGVKYWAPAIFPNAPFPSMIASNVIDDDPFVQNFDARLAKEKKEKDKKIENVLHLARKALSAGRLKQFHKAMKEAGDINPKHGVVKNYQLVKKELDRPFKDNDPAGVDLLKNLADNGFKPRLSDQGHYQLHVKIAGADRAASDANIKGRLAMMENTLETFYYWFAIQKEASLQPALPKYRLQAIMTNTKEEFVFWHENWGAEPMVGDGFAPRRDNVIVMSAKTRLNDPLFQEFDALLTTKLQDANEKLQTLGVRVTRDDLLSGKVNESKLAARMAALPLAYAQLAVLLSRALEDEAERLTVTNESVRQLLIASEMFPRQVQIPDWMVEGLAAFFETPAGVYPTIGGKNWGQLVSYKYFRDAKRLENPAEVLFNVVTDRYFQDARLLATQVRENPNGTDLRVVAKESWEFARCTSWAFIYYLAETRKLDYLFQYGKELNELPRDMDLSEVVLQGCFARAFGMTDNANPRRIDTMKLAATAAKWGTMMQETNLDLAEVQAFLLKMRARQDVDPSAAMEAAAGETTDAGATNPADPNANRNPGNRPNPGARPNPPGRQNPGARQMRPPAPRPPGG